MALTPEEKAAAKAAKDAEKAAAKAATSGDSCTVSWRGGAREFTREAHGDDFRAVAQEFADSHGREGVVA